jgi:hypothetical protein
MTNERLNEIADDAVAAIPANHAKTVRKQLLDHSFPNVIEVANRPDADRLRWLEHHDNIEALHYFLTAGAEVAGRPMTVREAIDYLKSQQSI